MRILHYIKFLLGQTGASKPAKINLKHIWAVIQAAWRAIFTPKHIKEQVQWRMDRVKLKSPGCLEAGHCLVCGCLFPDKMLADIPCDNEPYNCYPEMMNKKQWEEFKANTL